MGGGQPGRRQSKKWKRDELLELLIQKEKERKMLQNRVEELERAAKEKEISGGKLSAEQKGISGGKLSAEEKEISGEKLSAEGEAETAKLERELERIRYRRDYRSALHSIIGGLLNAAAAAVLIAVFWLPVFRIYGSSMFPNLREGDIVLAMKHTKIDRQDVIAFYSNNKILVKRVIATAGEWVDMDEDGKVTVDGEVLEEPYLTEAVRGVCEIAFPYEVPEGRLFVLGDNRQASADSRNVSVGCVAEDQIAGELKLRIWPLEDIEVF